MEDNFIRYGFDKVFNVEKLITVFYMELSKDFSYEGEKHDFWEMVYIDRGEMICTADKRQFSLKGGELTFHKPNEYHNLKGDGRTVPNVSIITFECRSRAMLYFEGKIFKLSAEERSLLALLMREGLAAYRPENPYNPLLQRIERVEDSPYGSSQMIKNVLEIFLISLRRNKDVLVKKSRFQYKIHGVEIPSQVKEIVDFLDSHVYDRLTVGDIARALGKSEGTVKKLFSQYREGGIIKYHNQRKIEEAKWLIRRGEYNFTQISELLHFDTPQYFSSCFKKFVHMSPQEYKKSIVD